MGQEKNLFCGHLSPTTKGKPYGSLLHIFSFIRSQGVLHTDWVLGIIQLTVPWYLFFARLRGFSPCLQSLVSFTTETSCSLALSSSLLLWHPIWLTPQPQLSQTLIAVFPTQHNFHPLLGFSLSLKHSRMCPQTERGAESRVHPIGCFSLRDHNYAKQLFGTIMSKSL